jgi:hypothetical protein
VLNTVCLLLQVYPRARWPTPVQIRGYGAWGGVAAATILYVIQVSCLRAGGADSAAAAVIPLQLLSMQLQACLQRIQAVRTVLNPFLAEIQLVWVVVDV